MCFSASASFTAAGLTAVIGLVALTRTSHPRDLLLAATPLVFALQQAVEGALWLILPESPDGALARGLTLLFLLTAEVFWPLFAPLAVLLIEPRASRRRLMLPCLALGLAVAGYLLWGILLKPHEAQIQHGHIVYVTEQKGVLVLGLAYLAATCLPLLLSSVRILAVLGIILLVGSATAYSFYWSAFVSVWCFFAAAASLVLLGHFELSRRRRLAPAAT